MARKSLSDLGVAALKPRPKRYAFADPELAGHFVRVQPSGSKTFTAVSRDPAGKQIWSTIGSADVLGIDEARARARTVIARIKDGLAAVEPAAETFEDVARQWLRRHVERKGLRSAKQIARLLELHVYDFWRGRPFLTIRRSDVARLLDDVEDGHGARQADQVLTVVRSLMNWFATRHDDYTPPLARGMRRQNPAEQRRERILNDDEIREVWLACEGAGTFGAFVRTALLTAQRRAKIIDMKWDDITPDGEWVIRQEPREKDSARDLMLPALALEVIRAQPRLANNSFVFASPRTAGPITGHAMRKLDFDRLLSGVGPYTLHDLRRTSRSLMSRAGVASEHAERIMGHAIRGVEGVYDRHAYRHEKADALARLAALIDGIVHPRELNVVPIIKGSDAMKPLTVEEFGKLIGTYIPAEQQLRMWSFIAETFNAAAALEQDASRRVVIGERVDDLMTRFGMPLLKARQLVASRICECPDPPPHVDMRAKQCACRAYGRVAEAHGKWRSRNRT